MSKKYIEFVKKLGVETKIRHIEYFAGGTKERHKIDKTCSVYPKDIDERDVFEKFCVEHNVNILSVEDDEYIVDYSKMK